MAKLGERRIHHVEPLTHPFRLAVADQNELHGVDGTTAPRLEMGRLDGTPVTYSAPVRAAPGWHPDPWARFEHRYHNGVGWTADVASDGHRYVDPGPLVGAPSVTTGRHGPPPAGRNGLATASMVCGITAVSTGWVPFVAVVMIVVAIVALALGLAALSRSRVDGAGRSFALTGIITGGAGVGVCVLGLVLTGAFLGAVRAYERAESHSVELETCLADGSTVTATGTLTNDGVDTATFNVLVEVLDDGTEADSGRATIDDLAAGATERFSVRLHRSAFADREPNCRVAAVNGPLPFGIDPAQFD